MVHITFSGDLQYSVDIYCKQCATVSRAHHRVSIVKCCATSAQKVLEWDFAHSTPNIPIGWSMNGKNHLLCNNCTKL